MPRRILRIAVVAVVAAAFAACSNPMAPTQKIPTQLRGDWVNPNGDWVNPNGDWVNPNG
jgi:hypothetical protein